jgi:RNA polymerase sigma factor (sigma-70 family)
VAGDDRLVEQVRAGSQQAFEVVYDRHHRGILSFARHMLGSQHDAEDAVQHTFMAAYSALLESEGEVQLRPWLYAIARNRCLSVIRARRELPAERIEETATEGLAEQVQQRDELRDMLRDLGRLPEEQRAALVLSELGALGHEEIAQVVGCPTQRVKALVFQARSSLQQSREARETSCREIRELLSTLRGGALRRTRLRRHLRECAGCREFEAEVKRQRQAMAVLLPVVPSLGLRDSALAAAFGAHAGAAGVGAGVAGMSGGAAGVGGGAAAAGTAGAGGVAGGLAAGGTTALVAKVLVVGVVAVGGAAGVKTVADDGGGSSRGTESSSSAPVPSGQPGMPIAEPGDVDEAGRADEPAGAARAEKARKRRAAARKRARARREAAGERGRANAVTRGEGKKRGLLGTQPGQAGDANGTGSDAKSPPRGRANGRSGEEKVKKDRPERESEPPPPERTERPPKPDRNPLAPLVPPGRS